MPTDFGSTAKHAFTARQFAEAFGARLISASALRLVLVPKLADTGDPGALRRLSEAEAILRQLTRAPVPVIFPLHPRTRRQNQSFQAHRPHQPAPAHRIGGLPVLLTLTRHAAGLITDSGGIQEEATILKRPILMVRRSNERPKVEQAFGSRTLPDDERISQT